MGTRSLTHIYAPGTNEGEPPLLTIYGQHDGYPEGHGVDLATLLAGMEVVNGFGFVDHPQANGAGCLAAQVVAHLKDGVGGIYIEPAGATDRWEEYVYSIRVPEPGGTITIRIEEEGGPVIFDGPPEALIERYVGVRS